MSTEVRGPVLSRNRRAEPAAVTDPARARRQGRLAPGKDGHDPIWRDSGNRVCSSAVLVANFANGCDGVNGASGVLTLSRALLSSPTADSAGGDWIPLSVTERCSPPSRVTHWIPSSPSCS